MSDRTDESASPLPRDVFEELFALLSPDRLLRDPRATGEGVRVCLLDSGVERSLLETRFRQRGQELLPIEGAIFTPESNEPLPYEGQQSSPHGTTVADIILTLAPRVRLFSADIFGPRGSCEVEVVCRALLGPGRLAVQGDQPVAGRPRAAPATVAAPAVAAACR